MVCSLEPWDDVWRRNQFFVDALLRHSAELRVLFVEPPADGMGELAHASMARHRPASARCEPTARLHALRPIKPLPRRFGSLPDRVLQRQVVDATERLGFTDPTLWLNDVTYAPLIARTGWPTVYDVTDDWLLAPFAPRELERLRTLDAIALADAQEVVVCSPALAASRGADRRVTLVPNGVDTEHFRRPRARPTDLPPAPTAVYVGTLHDARLDVDLVIELARSNAALSIVLVGPDSLRAATRRQLRTEANIHLLGSRPYADVPAYLQHADVLIVPHRVTPFTESLDPIKAYECLALATPAVATPVAGFRELAAHISVAERESFVEAVRATLSCAAKAQTATSSPVSWDARARSFETVLAVREYARFARSRGQRVSKPAQTPRSLSEQLRPLLGGRRTPIAMLVVTSVLAGLSEAAILAVVAQAGAALVDAQHHVHATAGPLHVTVTVGTLLAVWSALAVCRLALQLPLSVVPARLCTNVLAHMQRELFHAFTRASWEEQSRAREGHVQELVMNQVLQASWSALAATSLVTSALTLLILVASALLLNVVAALGVLVTVFLLFGLLRPLNELITRRSRALSQAQMDMASGVGQAARLAEETHVFGVAAAQREHMDGYVTNVRGLFYRTQMLSRLTPGIYQSIIYLFVVGGLSSPLCGACRPRGIAWGGRPAARASGNVRSADPGLDTSSSARPCRSSSVFRRWNGRTWRAARSPANDHCRRCKRWRSRTSPSRTKPTDRCCQASASRWPAASRSASLVRPVRASRPSFSSCCSYEAGPRSLSRERRCPADAVRARGLVSRASPTCLRNPVCSMHPSQITYGTFGTSTTRL